MKPVISRDVFFDFSRDVPRRLLGYNPENGEAPARIHGRRDMISLRDGMVSGGNGNFFRHRRPLPPQTNKKICVFGEAVSADSAAAEALCSTATIQAKDD